MNSLLTGKAIRRVFAGGDGQLLEILRGVDVEVRRGEFVAIVGSSGAGKSTLLHLLGALDSPSGGDIWLDGSRYADLDARGAAELRNRKLGFVFQFHHLLREFSALENVMMPLLIGGAVVTESVFAIPGLGRLTIDAILRRDYPVIQGIVLLFSFLYVLVNLMVDVTYTLVDPRIRY